MRTLVMMSVWIFVSTLALATAQAEHGKVPDLGATRAGLRLLEPDVDVATGARSG